MKWIIGVAVFGFLAGAGLLLGFAVANSSGKALKAGDLAPDFKLVGSDGKTYQLSDFRGKEAVVLAWFPKAFTSG